MFRYGILSTASIIDRFIAGIRESQDSYVQAIASRNLETAKKAAKRLNIENYYCSYGELLCANNIDIVYISFLYEKILLLSNHQLPYLLNPSYYHLKYIIS